MSSRPLRIGYLMQNYAPDFKEHGGDQVFIREIFQGLSSRGHHVRMVILSSGNPQWSDDLCHWSAIPCMARWRPFFHWFVEKPIRLAQTLLPILPYLNYFDSLRFADAGHSVLQNVDILIEHYSFAGLGGVLLSHQLQVPLLLELHGHPFDEMAHFGGAPRGLQRWASARVIRWTTDQAALVMPSGYGWKRRWEETGLLRAGHSRVVWPGVDWSLFEKTRDKQTVRRRYAIPDGPAIVFVGVFYAWQGLELLMQAFARILPRMPEAALVLIGNGPLEKDLQQWSQSYGCASNVRFLGSLPQTEVAAILCACDIGVQLYEKRAEFVGIKMFEYMAAGNAVIVTAPEKQHDLIVDEENGLVINPGNLAELETALLRLLFDATLRTCLGTNARQAVANQHTWEQRVEQIETLAYETIADRGRRS